MKRSSWRRTHYRACSSLQCNLRLRIMTWKCQYYAISTVECQCYAISTVVVCLPPLPTQPKAWNVDNITVKVGLTECIALFASTIRGLPDGMPTTELEHPLMRVCLVAALHHTPSPRTMVGKCCRYCYILSCEKYYLPARLKA